MPKMIDQIEKILRENFSGMMPVRATVSYRDIAARILETMRDPSEAMIEAGMDNDVGGCSPADYRFIYMAMIDAASNTETDRLSRSGSTRKA